MDSILLDRMPVEVPYGLAMRLLFTPLMKKRLTRLVHTMLRASLRHFPDLRGRTITIGYTRTNLGTAVLPRHSKSDPKLTVCLNARKLTYNTIGHELTHLVKGLSLFERPDRHSTAANKFPGGEKQCDIWTLARSSLFCNDSPSYLKLPRVVRENWPRYAKSVRALCIMAIEKRKTHRFYIRWLESEVKQLARKPLRESNSFKQLLLPLED